MFIVAKRNIMIPEPNGDRSFFIPIGYMGTVPEWAANTAYFRELVNDGKIVISESTKDKALDEAVEKPITDRARKPKDKKSEELKN